MIIVVSCPVNIIVIPICLLIVGPVPWVILSIIVSYPKKIRKKDRNLVNWGSCKTSNNCLMLSGSYLHNHSAYNLHNNHKHCG